MKCLLQEGKKIIFIHKYNTEIKRRGSQGFNCSIIDHWGYTIPVLLVTSTILNG